MPILSTLQTVLPAGYRLYSDESTRSLILLPDGGKTTLEPVVKRFTPNEWRLLNPLIEAFPNYSSYEKLLSSLFPLATDISQTSLQSQEQKHRWSQELEAVRSTIKNLRIKLSSFSFTISPVYRRGYVLTPLSTQK